MKKIIQTSFVAGSLFILFSFTGKTVSNFVGTYGISDNDPSQIELKLNEDKTFSYQDYSNPNKKISVKGNWEAKNHHIQLKNYTSEFPFHTKWRITKEGTFAKSRKGMTYYSLERK